MSKIIDLCGNECELENCLGCEIVECKLKPFGDILYKNEYFYVAQDFELPIDGFIIISTNRHIEQFTELTENERVALVHLIDKVLSVLKANNVAPEFNVILEEKQGIHFHVWLMPRHKWMLDKFGKIMKNLGPIQDFAKQNLRTPENIAKIALTCKTLKDELSKSADK